MLEGEQILTIEYLPIFVYMVSPFNNREEDLKCSASQLGCTDVPGLYRCARVVSNLIEVASTDVHMQTMSSLFLKNLHADLIC